MSNSKLSRWMPKCLRPVKKTRPLVRTSALTLHTLEAREVPASHVFAGSGLWSDSNNWQGGFKPATNETGAVITILNNVSSTLDISGMSIDQLNMPAGGTLTLTKAMTINGNGAANDNVVIGGNASIGGTPSITILSNTYFSVASGKTLTINTDITGNGGFVEEGSGSIKLQGKGTWQGETNIFSGNLNLSSPGNADVTLPNTTLVIGDGVGNNLSASLTLGANFEIPDSAPVIIRRDGLMNFAGFTEDFGDLELNGGYIFQNGGQWNVKGNIHATGDSLVVNSSANSNMNLGAFTPTITVDAGKTLTINSAIIGTGGVTLEGGGTLTYTTDSSLPTVANTYTGNTTVNNGTLILDNDAIDGAMAGNLLIAAANGPSLVQLLQSTELPNDKSVVLLVNGTLDLNGKSDTVGSVITAGGTITTGTGQLTLNGDLTASASNVTSKISGNLNLGAADRTFTIVDGTAAVDLQIDGTLKGNANNLIIDGDGTMVLQGGSASTYTGNTTVNDGTLMLGNALAGNLLVGDTDANGAVVQLTASNVLADDKAVVVLGDGQLKMSDKSDTINALIINGGTVTTGTGKLTLNGDLTASTSPVTSTFTGNLVLAAGDHNFVVPDGAAPTDLTIDGPITGAGGLIKTGAGLMELTGSSNNAFNTYAGQTWIQEGTLNLNTNTSDTGLSTNIKVGDGSGVADSAVLNVMGTFELPDAATLTINSDGRVNLASGQIDDVTTLNINGGELNTSGEFRIRTGGALNSDGTADDVIDGPGKFALNEANIPFNIADTAAATDLLISARITEFNLGSGFVKQGAGTLEIGGTASNIYTGATGVNGGTLLLNNGFTNGAISHTLNITQGTVKLGQSLEIPDDTTVTITAGGKLDLNSKAEAIGALNLQDNGVSVTTGTATLTLNGDVQVAGSGSSPITITGNIALPADHLFTVSDTPAVQDLILDGTITGAGGFTLDGGGTLAITGANDNTPNTYTGTTLIKNGTLFLDDDITNGTTSKTVIVGDGVGLPGTARLVLNQASEIPNDASVTVRGDGLWDGSNHNETITSLTLEGGEIANINSLQVTGDFTSLASPITAKIGGFVTLGNSSHKFTVADGPANVDVQINAVIDGVGGTLVKEGAGQLWLNADETFAKATVNAGTLHFLGDAATTDVTLNGGVLGGNVTLGKITGTGGVISPALAIDTASLTTKDFSPGAATYEVNVFDKNGYDSVNVKGAVNLTGTTLNLNLGYASSKNDTFKIIDNDGTADAVTGKFINTAADGTFTQNGRTFKVNYAADDGNDVTVTDVTAANPVLTGVKEFAVGSDVGGGSATLYNQDGSVRYSITPYEAGFTGGIRVAAGDFTGDGIADLVVASGPGRAGNVRIFDGVTKAQIFDFSPFGDTFTRGVVITAGDITGDGKAEVVITAERGGGARVRVFSPTGNGMVQTTDFIGLIGGDGVADTSFRGGARAAVGDVDGDGFGDLIFAAGAGGGPRVAIFDGKMLSQSGGPKLRGDFFAFEPSLRDGTYVAAGDFNGDGKVDLVAGAGPGGGPRVSIFNGADLVNNQEVKIKDFFAGDVSNRGGIRVTVKNLDNDSKGDLVVGAGPGGGSKVTAYTATEIAKTTSATVLDFDALAGFNGGVYVG